MGVIETALEDSGGKPDENARRKIGNLLEGTVRAVHELDSFDPPVSNGIDIRELSIDTGSIARLSFMDRQVVGVIETANGTRPASYGPIPSLSPQNTTSLCANC